MGSGWRSRVVSVWREDHLGDRDLTSWPSAAGRATVAGTGWALDRVRRALPGRLSERDLPWLVLAVIVGVGGALAVATTMLSACSTRASSSATGWPPWTDRCSTGWSTGGHRRWTPG